MRILIALGIALVLIVLFAGTGELLFAPLLAQPSAAIGFFITIIICAVVAGYLSAGAILEKPKP